ncbi:MAG TPA: hypothetical protein VMM12_00745 [Longimicrobiales bacterium]|nr:hypothetical protein [Longimicrobiales bacterium]
MIERWHVLPAVLAALPACAPGPPPVDQAPGGDSTADSVEAAWASVQGLSCEGLAWRILKVDPTRAELAAEFGRPDSIVATTEPNRHVRGQLDSLFTVHYPGLMSILRKPEGGRDMVDHAVVTANRFLAHPQIGIDAPAARVIQALGEPTRRSPAALVYECGDGAEEPVTFHLAGGAVSRIEIDFYLD